MDVSQFEHIVVGKSQCLWRALYVAYTYATTGQRVSPNDTQALSSAIRIREAVLEFLETLDDDATIEVVAVDGSAEVFKMTDLLMDDIDMAHHVSRMRRRKGALGEAVHIAAFCLLHDVMIKLHSTQRTNGGGFLVTYRPVPPTDPGKRPTLQLHKTSGHFNVYLPNHAPSF